MVQRSRALRALLRMAIRLRAPRQRVGAVALIVRDERVLVAEHAFRLGNPWGLPGGWIEAGEAPEDALARELIEELGVRVTVGPLMAAARHGSRLDPTGLTLVYRCSWPEDGDQAVRLSWELLRVRWLSADEAAHVLRPFEAREVQRALGPPDGSAATP